VGVTRHAKNLGQPEETIELEGIHEDAVEVGDFTVARVVAPSLAGAGRRT
jgi:hypothetical protein